MSPGRMHSWLATSSTRRSSRLQRARSSSWAVALFREKTVLPFWAQCPPSLTMPEPVAKWRKVGKFSMSCTGMRGWWCTGMAKTELDTKFELLWAWAELPVKSRLWTWATRQVWIPLGRTHPKSCSCWELMASVSPELTFQKTASSFTKVNARPPYKHISK